MESTDDQLRAPAEESQVAAGKKIGKYRIVRELGKGGMGTVYLAEDESLGRKIAVKAINTLSFAPDKRNDLRMRFEREARGAGRVSHPNVVTIHAYEQIGGRDLLAMEYVDGHTLRDDLQGGKALAPDRAAKIVIDLLRGVEAIHEAGLIHRDLKPANVMLTRDGERVKILDLGLVKFTETDDPANDYTLTQVGLPMGSPFYMSPEQINNRPEARAIDKRADIYAVGVMCFQLLTGKPPFDGKAAPIFDQHRHDPLPEIVSPYGEISPALKAIVVKAAAKKPSDRYQSATAMREAIERLFAPPARKRGAAATLALALIGPLVIGLAALVIRSAPSIGSKETVAKAATPEAAPTPHREEAPPPAPPRPTTETAKIAVPPPPDEVVPTTKAGCQAYESGRTSEATAILTKVIAKSPGDADALYCLCGSYARASSLASGQRATCENFLERASQGDDRRRQVKLWLKRGAR